MISSKDEKKAYNFKMTSIYNLDTEKEEAADYFLQQSEETVFKLRRNLHLGKKTLCVSSLHVKGYLKSKQIR